MVSPSRGPQQPDPEVRNNWTRWRGELRRQTAHQDADAAGPGRHGRLDPARVPHRFTIKGEALGDGALPQPIEVYLDGKTIVMKRRLSGLPLTVVLPVTTYLGVYAQVTPGSGAGTLSVRIGLRHRDPSLDLELCRSDDVARAADDWRAWGDSLGLPLLVVEPDGTARPVDEPVAPSAEPHVPTRRRIAALSGRRPRFLVRRKPGRRDLELPVHRGERELIARR